MGWSFSNCYLPDEVRALADLHIEQVTVSDTELKLALQIIDQVSEDAYDPTAYEDEEKNGFSKPSTRRLLASR